MPVKYADKSDPVAVFCSSTGLDYPQVEFKFHSTRRWRFDYCWPKRAVALELEGGVYTKGRHTRGAGFTNDCLKYSEAALLGWTVLRCTTGQFKAGIWMGWLERALGDKGAKRGA